MKCEERFNKSKAVQSILAHVAGKISVGETTGNVGDLGEQKLAELYEMISWPLDRRFGHAYDAFKLAVS